MCGVEGIRRLLSDDDDGRLLPLYIRSLRTQRCPTPPSPRNAKSRFGVAHPARPVLLSL
jgi:hypothetical protein